MSDTFDVIKSRLITEKGSVLVRQNKVLFSVRSDANKIQIKQAIESIYKVKVLSVNTEIVNGKLKRVRFKQGRTPDWKKAIVTLREGQKID